LRGEGNCNRIRRVERKDEEKGGRVRGEWWAERRVKSRGWGEGEKKTKWKIDFIETRTRKSQQPVTPNE
jgi:hypothetical protein